MKETTLSVLCGMLFTFIFVLGMEVSTAYASTVEDNYIGHHCLDDDCKTSTDHIIYFDLFMDDLLMYDPRMRFICFYQPAYQEYKYYHYHEPHNIGVMCTYTVTQYKKCIFCGNTAKDWSIGASLNCY